MSRNLINDGDFRSRNRTEDRYFTRCRKLTFVVVILLLLRKSAKSIQCVVNELFMVLGLESVTAAAFSQARKRIRHTAFIELNEQAIVNVMYREGEYLRYKGFRVLAIDGSKIRLPESEEINQEFGQVAYTNGQNEEIKGYHTYAQGSVLYDVLNHVAGSLGIPVSINLLIFLQIIRILSGRCKAVGRDDFGSESHSSVV